MWANIEKANLENMWGQGEPIEFIVRLLSHSFPGSIYGFNSKTARCTATQARDASVSHTHSHTHAERGMQGPLMQAAAARRLPVYYTWLGRSASPSMLASSSAATIRAARSAADEVGPTSPPVAASSSSTPSDSCATI